MLSFRRWPNPPRPVAQYLTTIKGVCAEFIGALLINVLTFTMVFDKQTYFVVAILYGLVNTAVCAGIAPISGGHLNPAVTIGLWTSGRISPYTAIAYVTAQCLGAVVGSFVLDFLTISDDDFDYPWTTLSRANVTETTEPSFGTEPPMNGSDVVGNMTNVTVAPPPTVVTTTTPLTTLSTNMPEINPNPILPQEGINLLVSFTVEFIAAFHLLLAICGGTREGIPGSDPVFPIIIFFSTTAGHLFTAAYTGAGLNPARVLGNARRYDARLNHYLAMYWAAICFGGAVGACVSRDVLHPRPPIL